MDQAICIMMLGYHDLDEHVRLLTLVLQYIPVANIARLARLNGIMEVDLITKLGVVFPGIEPAFKEMPADV